MRTITHIILHCSATPQGQQVTVLDVDRWHRERGFKRQAEAVARFNPQLKAIGYHYLISLGGEVFTGRGLDEAGAHVAGHNANTIGVCMVGMHRFTAAQWDALRGLVNSLRSAHPTAKICGHRDMSPDTDGDGVVERHEWLKECPTFDVATWLRNGMQPEAVHLVPA